MRFMTNNSILNLICLLAYEPGFMFSVLPFQLETFFLIGWLLFVLIIKYEVLVIHLTSVSSDLKEYKTNTQRLAVQWQDAGNMPFTEHHGPSLPALWPSAASAQLESHRPFKKKKKSLQDWELHVDKHHTSISCPSECPQFCSTCFLGGEGVTARGASEIKLPNLLLRMPNLVPWQSLTQNEIEMCRQSNWGGNCAKSIDSMLLLLGTRSGVGKGGSEGERGRRKINFGCCCHT